MFNITRQAITRFGIVINPGFENLIITGGQKNRLDKESYIKQLLELNREAKIKTVIFKFYKQ